jgi:hypothetical protein
MCRDKPQALTTVEWRRPALALGLALFLCASGCGPKYTYPADTVAESVETISMKDHKLSVTARVVGKTLGAVYYVENLIDDKGQIPKDVHETMGQIMQAVTRVALSTDLEIEFCVVVLRDRVNLNELTVTRSLEDTKRANSDALGIEESINRTLFGQGKYQAPQGAEPPFVLKEVKMENFLAEQIAQRIRFGFMKDVKEETAQQPLVLVDGMYDRDAKRFRFSVLSLKPAEPKETVLEVFHTINFVLAGYKFEAFSEIEILDYLNRQKLVVPQKALADYQAKKLTDKQVLIKYLSESQSIQEAFKLFGFNLPDANPDTEAPPLATATP